MERNAVWYGVAIESAPCTGVKALACAADAPPPAASLVVPPLRYPLYAGILAGDVRHDALEFSAAGMSLTLPVLEDAGLDHLRRGDECAVVLCVGGAGWQEEYDVVLRLAARGTSIAGFAFVGLPPLARVVLERHEAGYDGPDGSAWGDEAAGDVFGGTAAPFAFARLAEPTEVSRRFILAISETVFALTQRRNQPPSASEPPADAPPVRRRRPVSNTTPAGTALVYALALVAVLLIVAVMMFG